MKKQLIAASIVVSSFLAISLVSLPVSAGGDPTTLCTSSFDGADIAIRTIGPPPFLAFEASRASGLVYRYPITSGPGTAACSFGPALPILLGFGSTSAWGVTLSPGSAGKLFVSAGSTTIDQILMIVNPASASPGPPVLFFSPAGFHNFRSLAHIGSVVYAADFGTGLLYRFDLSVAPCTSGPFPVTTASSCVTVLCSFPGIFGLVPNPSGALDDLYATSNAGFNGLGPSGGTNDVKHIVLSTVTTMPASGIGFPEGIGASGPDPLCTSPVGCLYVAGGGIVQEYDLTTTSYSSIFPAPITASHGVTYWTGGIYVTDSISNAIFKIS